MGLEKDKKEANPMMLDEQKYRNAILYFVKHCNNGYLGNTKLQKLLYYLDFISYRDRNRPVTGERYIHNQYGPTPTSTHLILRDLKKDEALGIEVTTYDEGKEGFRYHLLKEPDPSVFDKYEQKLLHNICKELSLWSTAKIVEQTHLEAPWFYSKPLEEVDYNYARDIDIISSS